MTEIGYYTNDDKFWTIRSRVADNGRVHLTIRFGKLNGIAETNIKQIEKDFPTQQDCDDYTSLAVQMKIDKGYTEGKPQQPQQQQFIQQPPAGVENLAQLTDRILKQRKTMTGGRAVNLGQSGYRPKGVMLAQTISDEIDPTGYYMSEKLDGMRMVWTGTGMFSRNGNVINFPKFFVEGWPKACLDGELWLERDSFQKLVSITKRNVPDENDWRDVKYMVFDAPGLNTGFADRYEKFKAACEQSNQYIVYVPHIVCQSYDHLMEELRNVEEKEGEGLMLREPNSQYEQRRSNNLLKVKSFQDDEATVLGHEEGSGRCQGMLGALKVRNTKGIIFNIGSGMDDALRRKPPKIGSVVTYKYYGVSKKGTPRFPIYLRQRPNE